jgi:hypothetical protein
VPSEQSVSADLGGDRYATAIYQVRISIGVLLPQLQAEFSK